MPQLLFSFTMNTETQEMAVVGNIDAATALQVLQQIVIALAVSDAKKGSEASTAQPDTQNNTEGSTPDG